MSYLYFGKWTYVLKAYNASLLEGIRDQGEALLSFWVTILIHVIHMRTHIHTEAYLTCTYTCTQTYLRIHVHTNVRTRTHACTHARAQTHTQHTHTHTHVCCVNTHKYLHIHTPCERLQTAKIFLKIRRSIYLVRVKQYSQTVVLLPAT